MIVGQVFGLLVVGASSSEIRQIAERFVADLLKVVGWVTILAAAADVWISRAGVLAKWSPLTLRSRRQAAPMPESKGENRVVFIRRDLFRLPRMYFSGRFHRDSASQCVVAARPEGSISAVRRRSRHPRVGSGDDHLYPVLFVAHVAFVAQQFAKLRRHRALLRLAAIVLAANSFVLLFFMITTDHVWVMWNHAADARVRTQIVATVAGRQVSLMDLVNYCFSIPLTVAALYGVGRTLWHIVQSAKPNTVHA